MDYSGLAQLFSLLVLPFAHEDLAIIIGAYLISNETLPVAAVGVAIYGGMVASDFALYGIGAGARRLPWLNRYADHRVRRFSETLRRNIFGLVALCRIVPGIVFVAFVACGWSRVPLSRFTSASLIVSALYLPLTLYLVITFGGALDEVMGWTAWPLLFGALTLGGFARKKIFAFGDAADEELDVVPAEAVINGHRGMPALAPIDNCVAPAEKIPPALFYIPLVLSWIGLGIRHRCLTLPSVANPNIPTGGMWGEAKSDYFDFVSYPERNAIAPYVVMTCGDASTTDADCRRAMTLMSEHDIAFPVVAKPDIGWHGYGVQLINDKHELASYLAAFPANVALMLQSFVPYDGEAAVLYSRMPGDREGKIESLTLRYFPHVVGNGYSSVADLVLRDARARWKADMHLGLNGMHAGPGKDELSRIPARGEIVKLSLIGNQRAGGLYRDGHSFVTHALNQRFDAIARAMPDFHYGRFDIRFDNVDRLMRGEGFKIVEINGIGGEAIDAWDARLSVLETYRRLYRQQKLLFRIGERNRARGFRPMPAAEFLGMLKRQTELIQLYPASE